MSRFCLAFPGSGEDRLDVKLVASGQPFPDTPNLFNDGILCHNSHSPKSSSGVQITGHGKPCCPQTFATAFAITAFARCAQFQVIRNSIPWTAATARCAASVAALGGITPEPNMRVVSVSTSGVMSSKGKPLIAFSLSRAASASPAFASSRTSCDMKIVNAALRFVHHSLVICWCPAMIRSRLGQDVR